MVANAKTGCRLQIRLMLTIELGYGVICHGCCARRATGVSWDDLLPPCQKIVILNCPETSKCQISSFSALKNLIAHQKMARVIVRILMYRTTVFSCLPSQNHTQRAENPSQIHKLTGETTMMASTDVPNAPVTPQEVPRKMSQRDRETAILFYLTLRVKADGGKLKGCIVSEAALNFRHGTAIVKRCWKKCGAYCLTCLILSGVDNPIVVGWKKESGRPRKWTLEDIQAAMKELPFSQ
jgi:hypothetical protein